MWSTSGSPVATGRYTIPTVEAAFLLCTLLVVAASCCCSAGRSVPVTARDSKPAKRERSAGSMTTIRQATRKCEYHLIKSITEVDEMVGGTKTGESFAAASRPDLTVISTMNSPAQH